MTAWPDALKLFFFGFWMFFGIYYGDVLYIAQQYSFFSWPMSHAPAMGNLLRFVVDYRACLAPSVPFAFLGRCPPLGHAHPHLLAVRLCLQVGKGRFGYLKYIPAFVFIWVVYHGFDIYYQTETGKLLGIPFCILPILACRYASFVLSAGKLSGCCPTGL